MHRLRPRLSYANVVATLALIVAVAGIPAAVAVTKSSSKSDVSKKGNIRAGRVTTPKLADAAVTSPKLGGIDLVEATDSQTAKAICPPGERVLGGGGEIASGGAPALAESRPLGSNIWLAVQNGGSGTATVTAYALCLQG
jgi:hypothetical protein